MAFKVFFTRKAEKELGKIAKADAKQILKRLLVVTFPFPKNYDIDSYSGFEGWYRLRVGRLRCLIEVDRKKQEIWVRKVGYRGGVYK